MSTVCHCGHPSCPAIENKPERCAAACCDCLRAEIASLVISRDEALRLAEARLDVSVEKADLYHKEWRRAERAESDVALLKTQVAKLLETLRVARELVGSFSATRDNAFKTLNVAVARMHDTLKEFGDF